MEEQALRAAGIDFREKEANSGCLTEMRKRAERCVCRYCGSPLSLRKVTYAAYDAAKIECFCETCKRIEYGVEPEIYRIAEYYVDEMRYDHYPNLDASVRKRRMNISLVCNILAWGAKSMQLLDADGFRIEVALDEELLAEATLLSETELREMDGE